MSSRLNRPAFEGLIAENIAWLLKQPRTLERDHIEHMLRDAPGLYYGSCHCGHPTGRHCERTQR